MKFAVRFEGGAQLARALNELPRRVSGPVLRETLRTIAAPPIQQAAAAKAPVDPGAPDIANHIVVGTARGGGGTVAVVVGPSNEPRTDQPTRTYGQQGIFVEFGTEDTPMQAFMRPAFDSEAQKTLGPIGMALWRALISRGLGSGRSSGGGIGETFAPPEG